MRKLNFSRVHVFRYSARPGTVAASMPNQIPEPIKKERVKELIRVAKEEREKFARKFVGRNARIIVEDFVCDGNATFAKGTTDRYYEALVPIGGAAKQIEIAPGDVLNIVLRGLQGDVFTAEPAQA